MGSHYILQKTKNPFDKLFFNPSSVFISVPDCDCAIMFCGGSARRVGSAVSWILLGALKPMAYTPFRRFGWRFNSSKDFTEYNGQFGSFLWISRSFLFSTKLFRITFCNKDLSAAVIFESSMSTCFPSGTPTANL